MALASWTGLYTPVVQDFMKAKRIKELMLLQAIAGFADPFGFAFPGGKALMSLMRCSKKTLTALMAFLVDGEYIKVYETYNPRRGKTDIDYQINPCVLYVREEIQPYCEALWNGAERDFSAEKKYRENLFSTKDSQPESESESVPESVIRVRNQSQHQQAALIKPGPIAPRPVTTGQRDSATPQRRKAHDSENNPQAGGAAPGKRDLTPYRKPFATLDDEQLAQDIKLTCATQLTQARWAVATYDRAELRIALELTRQKRARGEVLKPGGYFFAMLENGVILPADDGPGVYPPRTVYGETPDQDSIEHWNPETGRYEPAAGE
jgi:hypothetical protein